MLDASIDRAQHLVDEVDAQLRSIARRAGVEDEDLTEALVEFAREVAGVEIGKHRDLKLSRFKTWFRGYAVAMRVARRRST